MSFQPTALAAASAPAWMRCAASDWPVTLTSPSVLFGSFTEPPAFLAASVPAAAAWLAAEPVCALLLPIVELPPVLPPLLSGPPHAARATLIAPIAHSDGAHRVDRI